MSEALINVLLAPFVVLLYASGLLLWPIRRWRMRTRAIRGKSLGFVLLGQIISYVAVAVVATLRPWLLEHGYYWFIILIELNIIFTIAGAIAWIRDSYFERRRAAIQSVESQP
jgi:hypothetical protein